MQPDMRCLAVAELASVTVTFNPSLELMQSQLDALHEVGLSIIVDNGSRSDLLHALRVLAEKMPRVRLLENESNLGLAAALNRGIAFARESDGIEAVLLLDQDSTFDRQAPSDLVDALNQVQNETGVMCCVGPALRDPGTGLSHGFHYVRWGWLWARANPPQEAPPFPVANLNGSGTTMPLALVDAVGMLDAAMFIDHVDTEWSFRVTSKGCGLYGIPWIFFNHLMGERGRRLWIFGWRVWPERTPLRHYYLYRNTIALLRRAYVPRIWKLWATAKSFLTLLILTLHGPERGKQWRMIGKGIFDGLKGVYGG